MTTIARIDVRLSWPTQTCDSQHITSIEHARYVLTNHSGHGCERFYAALDYSSGVCQ